MKYLGIDYGKKKVGLALSEGVFAQSWKIIEVSSLKDAVEKIHAIIKKEDISCVVIGLAESGEARKMTSDFIKALKEKMPDISLFEREETLSSKKALDQMIEMNISKQARKQEDAYAAAFILQEYLEENGLSKS